MLPVMMARSSMKFSLTDQVFSSPSFLSAAPGLRGPVGGFEDGELLGGEGEGLFEGALFREEDLGRGKDVVGEEEVGEVAELAEGFDAGLDERCDLAEIVVAEDGGAERGVEVLGR